MGSIPGRWFGSLGGGKEYSTTSFQEGTNVTCANRINYWENIFWQLILFNMKNVYKYNKDKIHIFIVILSIRF